MSVSRVERLDLRFEPKRWAFADERRAEIDEFFAARQRANPRLWNGRVLLMHDYKIDAGILHGVFMETDYASFHSWLAWGRPEADVWDCFGAAAVLSSDGAFLLGQMADHTANAGRIYFPCGTPDPSDVTGRTVDFEHSVGRELLEETGLDSKRFAAEPGWAIIEERARVVAYKVLRAREPARALREQVETHMAADAGGELAAVCFARSSADINAAMPAYVTAFLTHYWR